MVRAESKEKSWYLFFGGSRAPPSLVVVSLGPLCHPISTILTTQVDLQMKCSKMKIKWKLLEPVKVSFLEPSRLYQQICFSTELLGRASLEMPASHWRHFPLQWSINYQLDPHPEKINQSLTGFAYHLDNYQIQENLVHEGRLDQAGPTR